MAENDNWSTVEIPSNPEENKVEYEVEADTEDEAITKCDNYDYTEISDSEPEIEDEMFEECTLVTEPEITDEMTAATYNVT